VTSVFHRRAAPLVAVVGALALQACSISREIRPVGQGNWAAGLSFGGPGFTNLGGWIPTPVVSTYARYGLLPRLDLDFALDLTPARIQGTDVGLAYEFVEQNGAIPAIMAGGRYYFFVNGLGVTPDIDPNTASKYSLEPIGFEETYVNASWKIGRPVLIWAGLDLFAQAEKAIFLPGVQVGIEYRWSHVGLALEVKDEGLGSNQQFSLVSFAGPGHYGAIAAQIGLNIYPGGTL